MGWLAEWICLLAANSGLLGYLAGLLVCCLCLPTGWLSAGFAVCISDWLAVLAVYLVLLASWVC